MHEVLSKVVRRPVYAELQRAKAVVHSSHSDAVKSGYALMAPAAYKTPIHR